MKEEKLTEQQWIAKMKKYGFGLYKTKEVKKKYRLLAEIQRKVNELMK